MIYLDLVSRDKALIVETALLSKFESPKIMFASAASHEIYIISSD